MQPDVRVERDKVDESDDQNDYAEYLGTYAERERERSGITQGERLNRDADCGASAVKCTTYLADRILAFHGVTNERDEREHHQENRVHDAEHGGKVTPAKLTTRISGDRDL